MATDDPLGTGCALVTGASRGIGAAVALALARRGWRCGVHCREDIDGAEKVAGEIHALGGQASPLRGHAAHGSEQVETGSFGCCGEESEQDRSGERRGDRSVISTRRLRHARRVAGGRTGRLDALPVAAHPAAAHIVRVDMFRISRGHAAGADSVDKVEIPSEPPWPLLDDLVTDGVEGDGTG